MQLQPVHNKTSWYFFISLGIPAMVFLSGCQPSAPLHSTFTAADTPGVVCQPNHQQLQLSSDTLRRNPLQTDLVSLQPVAETLTAPAQIHSDETRTFHINPFVTGRVLKDNVQLGNRVQAGQVLAIVENREVTQTMATFLHEFHSNQVAIHQAETQLHLAEKVYRRERELYEQGVSPRMDYERAQTNWTLAQSNLAASREHATHIKSEARALLDLYGSHLNNPDTEHIQTTSRITAPHAGIITKKTITVGDMVSPPDRLYEVSDLSAVWLDITVYPTDVSRVIIGQKARFTSDSLPGRVFQGMVSYVQPIANQASETFVARVVLSNKGFTLRPGMRGWVQLTTPHPLLAPTIAQNAVQREGEKTMVFLAGSGNRFTQRMVRLKPAFAHRYQVLSGIKPGDRVVTEGSFLLKSSLANCSSQPED